MGERDGASLSLVNNLVLAGASHDLSGPSWLVFCAGFDRVFRTWLFSQSWGLGLSGGLPVIMVNTGPLILNLGLVRSVSSLGLVGRAGPLRLRIESAVCAGLGSCLTFRVSPLPGSAIVPSGICSGVGVLTGLGPSLGFGLGLSSLLVGGGVSLGLGGPLGLAWLGDFGLRLESGIRIGFGLVSATPVIPLPGLIGPVQVTSFRLGVL